MPCLDQKPNECSIFVSAIIDVYLTTFPMVSFYREEEEEEEERERERERERESEREGARKRERERARARERERESVKVQIKLEIRAPSCRPLENSWDWHNSMNIISSHFLFFVL
jgi:hypothetical protein